jgi:putative nucleotidyltransferase with HDIG domain
MNTSLPNKAEATALLHTYVHDTYQRHHAAMVARCTEGYAELLGEEDTHLWWLTGYLHDIDYELHPTSHPGPSLTWFRNWQYPHELIHAVEAHADGFNGFTTKPETALAKTLIACDEICGIFYAYQKLNPVPYGEMKVSSIKKRLAESKFAPGINREHIHAAIANLDISLDDHIANLITFFKIL